MILDILSGLNQIPDAEIVETGQEEVGPGEEVKGVLGPRLRQLSTAISRYAKRIEAEVTGLIQAGVDLNDSRFESFELGMKGAELLKNIFWQEVREEFNLPKERIGIRAGWKVVVDKEDEILSQLRDVIISAAISQGDCGDPNCPLHGRQNQQRPFVQSRRGQA